MAESKSDRRDDDDQKEEKDPGAKADREPEGKAEAAGGSDDSGDEESAGEEKQAGQDKKKAEPDEAGKAAAAAKKTVPQSPKAKAAAPAAKQEPGLMTPTNIALMLAGGGLLAFWKGVTLYKADGKDFYSASAWLFVIAFFAVTVSAFHFIGGRLPAKPDQRVQRLESRLLESLVPALPFFALYAVIWWVAWDQWKAMYPGNSWMWMFFIGLGAASWGTWHALKPPSQKELERDELPTRRVILLLMVPFVAVFGMIWLAERVTGR